MSIVIGAPVPTSFVISESLFGGNNLFLHNLLSGSGASFSAASELLNLTGLRFPGGTMTELNFDIENPDGPPLLRADIDRYVGITEFLTYASTQGQSPTIVLPTEKIYLGSPNGESSLPRQIDDSYVQKILHYVRNLITHGDSSAESLPDCQIESFEIGNEYWGSGNMTAKEYGQLVNVLIPKILDVFDEVLASGEFRPKIIVQMGSPWDAQYNGGIYSNLTWAQKLAQCNQDIIEQIQDPVAKMGISGLIDHYYYTSQLDALGQNSASNSYIDVDLGYWEKAGFVGRDLVFTEWGVDQHNTSNFGLKGASVLIEQMEHMIKLGVDSAFVWPVQGWNTALAGSPNSSPMLTPMGAAFKFMAESIIGTELLANGVSDPGLEINTFGSSMKTVLFVMSRSDSGQIVDLDVSNFVSDYSKVTGVKIGIAADANVDDPSASALLTQYSGGELIDGGDLRFELGSYEVIRIEFLLSSGHRFQGTFAADSFTGGEGDDTLMGEGGGDTLVGGQGDDFVTGNSGRDMLNGWSGYDTICGGSQGDLLHGQENDDRIFGNRGSDILAGDDGADALFGGTGADQVNGGSGSDTLTGGLGEDIFVFNTMLSVTNRDIIADFNTGNDTIKLENTGVGMFNSLAPEALAASAFKLIGPGGTAVDADDRVLYKQSTGQLFYDADGSGAATTILFATLIGNPNIDQTDFLVS